MKDVSFRNGERWECGERELRAVRVVRAVFIARERVAREFLFKFVFIARVFIASECLLRESVAELVDVIKRILLVVLKLKFIFL